MALYDSDLKQAFCEIIQAIDDIKKSVSKLFLQEKKKKLLKKKNKILKRKLKIYFDWLKFQNNTENCEKCLIWRLNKWFVSCDISKWIPIDIVKLN